MGLFISNLFKRSQYASIIKKLNKKKYAMINNLLRQV